MLTWGAVRRSVGGIETGPFGPFTCAWRQRNLVVRLTRREIEARYRGSLLGGLWSVVQPLLLLVVYTFVFTQIFRARWSIEASDNGLFALLVFAGLATFNIFADCLTRAPGLMLENVGYIKRVVFPLEIMPWVALLGTLFNAAISFALLMIFSLVMQGPPPMTALLLPVVLVPLVLLALGASWFLASIGVFLRDVRQVIGIVTTMLLFLSPVFYPVAAVPEVYRGVLHLSPLTLVLEQVRAVLLGGAAPDWLAWGLLMVLGWLVAWLGYVWFQRTRKGFADVV